MSKRPWKKVARIERLEFNSGDVVFRTYLMNTLGPAEKRADFQSLPEAEADLNAWWLIWDAECKAEHLKQIKHRRKA